MMGGIGSWRILRVPPYCGVWSVGVVDVGDVVEGDVVGEVDAGLEHPLTTMPTARIKTRKTSNRLFIGFPPLMYRYFRSGI